MEDDFNFDFGLATQGSLSQTLSLTPFAGFIQNLSPPASPSIELLVPHTLQSSNSNNTNGSKNTINSEYEDILKSSKICTENIESLLGKFLYYFFFS